MIRIGEVSWGQVVERHEYKKKKFTLYSVSHEEPQLNILSYKAASDMFSLDAVFCP